jgi:hypothetical protein
MAAPYLCKDEDGGENREQAEKRKGSFEREHFELPLSLSSALLMQRVRSSFLEMELP